MVCHYYKLTEHRMWFSVKQGLVLGCSFDTAYNYITQRFTYQIQISGWFSVILISEQIHVFNMLFDVVYMFNFVTSNAPDHNSKSSHSSRWQANQWLKCCTVFGNRYKTLAMVLLQKRIRIGQCTVRDMLATV